MQAIAPKDEHQSLNSGVVLQISISSRQSLQTSRSKRRNPGDKPTKSRMIVANSMGMWDKGVGFRSREQLGNFVPRVHIREATKVFIVMCVQSGGYFYNQDSA